MVVLWEYIGSTVEYIGSSFGYVEYVRSTLGYVGSALESIAFVTSLENIICTLGCFGSTLGYVGSILRVL